MTADFEFDQIRMGDAAEVLKTFPDSCIDLIVTSPPYANNRNRLTQAWQLTNTSIGFYR